MTPDALQQLAARTGVPSYIAVLSPGGYGTRGNERQRVGEWEWVRVAHVSWMQKNLLRKDHAYLTGASDRQKAGSG